MKQLPISLSVFLSPALAALIFLAVPAISFARSANGDFNGDGFEDLAVGLPNDDIGSALDAGAVVVFYGGSAGLTTTNAERLTSAMVGFPPHTQDHFGAGLASGDFDLDGFADLAVGSPGRDFTDGFDDTNAGQVLVFEGSASGLIEGAHYEIDQATSGIDGVRNDEDQFGFALTSGDFDHNFVADLIVGVPGERSGSDEGVGQIVTILGVNASGLTGASHAFHSILSFGATSHYGAVLASGDVDGDGFDDILVGAPDHDTPVTDGGSVEIVFGAANGFGFFSGQNRLVQPPSVAGEHYGAAIAVGDINGDGVDDVVVGMPDRTVSGVARAGAIQVSFGRFPGAIPAAAGSARTMANLGGGTPGANDRFGASLALGNFNGDAFADLAIGVPGRTLGGLQKAGIAMVAHGQNNPSIPFTGAGNFSQDSQSGTTKSIVLVKDVSETSDEFGSTLTLGDFNHTDRTAIAIGVPGENSGSGALNVLYTAASGIVLTGNQLFVPASGTTGTTADAGDRFSASLSGSALLSPNGAGFAGAWDQPTLECENANRCGLKATLYVNNPGQLEAAASTVQVYLSSDEIVDGGDLAIGGLRSLDELRPGDTVTVDVAFETTKKTSKKKRLIAVLDTSDAVTEVDEGNNTVVSSATSK